MLTNRYEITDHLEQLRKDSLQSEFNKALTTYSFDHLDKPLFITLEELLKAISKCGDNNIKQKCEYVLQDYVEAEDDEIVVYW